MQHNFDVQNVIFNDLQQYELLVEENIMLSVHIVMNVMRVMRVCGYNGVGQVVMLLMPETLIINPMIVEIVLLVIPFPNPQIAGYIATTTQFYYDKLLLSNAVAKIGPNVRRLILRPMPRPYDVAFTLHFDQTPHPKVEFLFMSEEKQVRSEEDQAEWFDYPKKHWRENLIAGMEGWSARAGPARCEMWYI
jgi:hypothetical protein